MYHGPASSVLPYFSSIGYICDQHDNPADFLLDITQGDHLAENVDPHEPDKNHEQSARHLRDLFKKSDIYKLVEQEIINFDRQTLVTTNLQLDCRQSVSKSRLLEVLYVAQRTLRNVYRNPALVTMQAGVSIIFAVLIGLIYLQVDNTEDTGVRNRLGALFFIITNQVMGNLSAIELFLKERVLFMHENASGYYHVSTYFIAKLVCDLIPLRLIPSIFFSSIVYFMIGFQRTAEKFFIFYFAIFITTTCGAALCFLLSASVQVFGIANLLAAMCFVLMMAFGGFLVELSSVIKFLLWIKWVSIFRYSYNIVNINEFIGLKLCSENGTVGCSINGTDILRKVVHVEYEFEWDLWKNFLALASMTLMFFLLTYIQLLRMKKTK